MGTHVLDPLDVLLGDTALAALETGAASGTITWLVFGADTLDSVSDDWLDDSLEDSLDDPLDDSLVELLGESGTAALLAVCAGTEICRALGLLLLARLEGATSLDLVATLVAAARMDMDSLLSGVDGFCWRDNLPLLPGR